MKITAQLIQHSHQFTNPLNQRQLDLRGYKLSHIENMGATLNFFQCIDLSDNEIRKLDNFSFLDKLNTLILTNNRIKQICDISQSLPNIQNIFLMNNKISELSEVDKLGNCRKLQRLQHNFQITDCMQFTKYPVQGYQIFKKFKNHKEQKLNSCMGVRIKSDQKVTLMFQNCKLVLRHKQDLHQVYFSKI